ncbi:unnamed protein product [Mytilus coruscus]|uniref:Uncharacterized protein n=1 Tax=Mytilus coruscus TaxID=42192 RepID=A0A6J8DYF7_MYTCO|nr:unnamed protein product [Mytilus coruscus]
MNSSADISGTEFIKGIPGNHISDSSFCRCCLESSSSETVKEGTTENYRDLFVEPNRESKSVRLTRKELKRPDLSKLKFKTHRPSGIKHLYDTDTELVLTLSIRHARKVRPKIDKSTFEHPKRTVIYSHPETVQTFEEDKPHVNNTITNIHVQRRGFGILLPVVVVTCIFLLGTFSVLFALLFRNHR